MTTKNSDKVAPRRAQTAKRRGTESSTDTIVELLTSIFQQVGSRITAPPLEGKAEAAVTEFQRIKAGLALGFGFDDVCTDIDIDLNAPR